MAKMVRKGNGADKMKQLRQAVDDIAAFKGQAGWFESNKYPDGTPVAYVAQIQNNGHAGAGIPPRPFMEPARQAGAPTWSRMAEEGAIQALEGKRPWQKTLDEITQHAAGQIKKAIAAVQSPALKKATVDARLREKKSGANIQTASKPLVASGLLIATPVGKVERK